MVQAKGKSEWTREELEGFRRIQKYVFGLSRQELLQPVDRKALEWELKVDNPVAIDVVLVWLQVRRNRLIQEEKMLNMVGQIKREVDKFHKDREWAAADLYNDQYEATDEWEDED